MPTADAHPAHRGAHLKDSASRKREQASRVETLRRQELVRRLVCQEWAEETWKPRGIAAERLESLDQAQALLDQVDRLQALDAPALRSECQAAGVRYDPRMQAQALRDRLRDAMFLEYVPVKELQRQCQEQGVAVVEQPGSNAADIRRTMADRLLLHSLLLEWESQGIPVLLLEDGERAAQLVESIDHWSRSELFEWYSDAGFPEGRGLESEDFAALLKMVSVWQALPPEALRELCARQQLPVQAQDDPQGRDEKVSLASQLFVAKRMDAWEAQGFHAKGMGSVESVIHAIERYERLLDLQDTELGKLCREQDLPYKEVGREDRLKMLKTVLV